MPKFKLLQRWSTTYFPWLQDNKWSCIGEFYTIDDATDHLKKLAPIPAMQYLITTSDDTLHD